jgi:hypothetical protein
MLSNTIYYLSLTNHYTSLTNYYTSLTIRIPEEEEYFQDLMEMREFLGRVCGVSGPALTAQPLKEVTKSESGTVTNMKQKD